MADLFDAVRDVFSSDNNIREFKSEDNGHASLLGKGLLVAAGTTAALYGLGRTGALRHLSDNAHLLGRTIQDAGSKFANESPLLTRFANSTTDDLVKSFRRHWQESLVENQQRMASSTLYNGRTYAERIAANALRMDGSIGNKIINEAAAETVIGQYSSEFQSDELRNRVHHFMTKAYRDKNHTVEEIAQQLQEDFGLEESLSAKLSRQAKAFVENNTNLVPKNELDEVRDTVHKTMVQEVQNVLGVAGEDERSFLTGYKKATLEDLLRANEEGQIKMADDQRKFLQEVVDNAMDVDGNKVGKRILADKNVFVGDDGKLIDMRTLPGSVRNFAEEYSDTMPAKIFHVRDILYKQDERVFEYFGKGASNSTIAHLTGDKKSSFLSNPALHLGKHIYDLNGNNLDPDHSYRLLSAEYGTIARSIKKMFGLSADRERDKLFGVVGIKNEGVKKVLNFLDIGNQEGASGVEKAIGLFSKKHNPKWDRNIIDRALNGGGSKEDFDRIANFFDRHVDPMSTRTWNNLVGELKKPGSGYAGFDLDQISLRNNDEIEKALKYFQQSSQQRQISNDRLKWILKQYDTDPHGFLNRSISVSNKVPVELLENIKKITGYDIAKREMQKEILLQSSTIQGAGNLDDLFKRLSANGKITRGESKQASRLLTFAGFDALHSGTKTTNMEQRAEYVKKMNEFFTTGQHAKANRDSINKLKNTYASTMQSVAFTDNKKDKVNIKHFSFRDDSKVFFGLDSKNIKKAVSTIKGINSTTKAKAAAKQAGSVAYSIFNEIRAGKNRPQDVTAATISSYFYIERLNEHLANVGLGLSDKSLKSAGNAAASMMTKRVLPVILGVQALNYADYRTEKYTGIGLYAGAYNTWANTNVGLHKIADVTKINSAYKWLRDINPALQYVDENGAMTAEELKDHYQNGYDPIRRGRFWSLSSTPWRGESIEYWRPSRHRLINSNYKYTDSLYGSKEEYWKNHWLPTPAHPFAPVRHFITDRYHWEKKHKKDRPYPYTSPLFEEGTPWGAVLNPTVGEIIKPVKRMHSWEMNLNMNSRGTGLTASINRAIKDKAFSREREKTSKPMFSGMAVTDSHLGLVAQRFVPEEVSQPGYYVQNMQYTQDENGINITQDYGPHALTSGAPINAGVTASSGGYFIHGAGAKSVANVSNMNYAIKNRAAATPVQGTFLDSSIYASYKKSKLKYHDAAELYSPDSTKAKVGDLEMSFKDISGIWGFFYNTATDTGAEKRSRRIANAGNMTGNARAFWDESLGGLGGSLSEIGRRFLPRPNRDGEPYNPLRNTMPTWMPEKFRTGDPYAKIKQGEARLPGAGYESLNKLHSDQFGRYGSFDRFKILADIAPYSDEYKIWKGVAERNATPALKQEMERIKERVAAQKKQHSFYSYRFKYSDLTRKSVTVAEILDKNTFISHEMPDSPIKMAGINLTAEGGINNILRVGQAVDIAYAKDGVRRYNKDTYGSINAVLYANGNNLNKQAIEDGHATEDRKDLSVAGVRARYNDVSMALGKVFETITHNDTIPGLSMLNRKFFRVRSPYEEYARTEVYGKPYTSWTSPIDSYIKPMIENAWSKGAFWGAAKVGTGFGVIAAVAGGSRLKRIKVAAGVGAAIGLIGGLRSDIGNLIGKPYIPDRVKKRREIEDYFDKLKYVKYKGLYERARQMAYKYEGVSVESEIKKIKEAQDSQSSKVRYLNSMKKRAYIYSKTSHIADGTERKAKIKELNQQMENAKAQKQGMRAGKYTMAALMYREQMESTMFGLSENAAWMNIVKALPKRDREYFTEFVEAPQQERKKILRIVSKQQGELLRKIWKQSEDKDNPIKQLMSSITDMFDKDTKRAITSVKNIVKPHIQDVKKVSKKVQKDLELAGYFSEHSLPGKRWAGWRPDVNLDSVKVKVMNHEGIDISDAGYTKNDLQEARATAPPAFDIYKRIPTISTHITNVLSGAGLNDVQVIAVPTEESGLSVKVDMMFRKLDKISSTIGSILS